MNYTYEFLTMRNLYNMKMFKVTILDYIYIPSYFPNF